MTPAHELEKLRAIVAVYERDDKWLAGYLARMLEIRQYRHEISQKQKRENKLMREVEYHKRNHYRLLVENEALKRAIGAFGLPREQMAELGRTLLDIFGKVPA